MQQPRHESAREISSRAEVLAIIPFMRPRHNDYFAIVIKERPGARASGFGGFARHRAAKLLRPQIAGDSERETSQTGPVSAREKGSPTMPQTLP
jgi:hypothetical protein